MQDIDDLIEYEPENTGIDFKAIQYKKEQFFELLKDIIAMANSELSQDGLIITGVKKHSNNTFTINPIPETEFTDSADYQKLVDANIEPDLHIDYTPHLYKGIELVGVLRIAKGTDKPYMMKKDFSSGTTGIRKRGESFIRRGTTTSPLMRKDIDRIFEQRKQQDNFNHKVSFYFSGTDKQKVIEIKPVRNLVLPSQKKANEIQSLINAKEKQKEEKDKVDEERRKKLLENPMTAGLSKLLLPTYTPSPIDFSGVTGFGPAYVPYEKRSIETLKKNLENVTEKYEEEDLYEVYEKKSEKLNFTVLNEGDKYLEDAVIKVEIPRVDGLFIADKIYKKPINRDNFNTYIADVSWEGMNYSKYKLQGNSFIFDEHLKDLRHLQPKNIFEIPLRIFIGSKIIGKEIEIKLTLFGKNLIKPIVDTLLVRVK